MRYTGTNPNGINQVASGSVGVFVENTRVATFGTNTLQVTGSSLLSGSLNTVGTSLVTGSLNASGSVSVIGIETINGSLQVTGSTVLTGSVLVTGPQSNFGNVTVTGSTVLSSSLNVIGTFLVTGSTSLSGSLTAIGTFVNNGNTVITGSLTVVTGSSVELQVTNIGVKIGNASNDFHTVTGSLSVTGSESLIGPKTINGNLTGTGSSVLSGSLSVTGITNISGSLGLVSGSAGVHVSQSLRQVNSTGSFIYGLNVTPTFTNTAPSQTQTAFRVNATFTGSFTGSSTSNVIADFGAASVGSQLTITDVTSGSIYMVNDVSGLPIIEATSDWTVNMYNYPSVIFRKTGSALVLGANNVSSSVTTQASASFTAPVTFRNDTIFDEGVGVVYRMIQVSASTNAVAIPTASLYTLPMTVSSSVSMIALITGYGTGSRDTVSGEIRSTIKRVGGNASIVGTNIRFITADFSGSDANIVVSGSNAILVVTGSTTEPYAWRATITTQIV